MAACKPDASVRPSNSSRRWSDERDVASRSLGVALQALERHRQAAAMFRLVAKTKSWLAKEMRARLEAMRAPINGDVAD